jgi:hypothetical protein
MALSWVCLDDAQPLQRSRASTFLFCRVHSCDRHEVRGSGDEGGGGGNSSHVPRIAVDVRAQFLLLPVRAPCRSSPWNRRCPQCAETAPRPPQPAPRALSRVCLPPPSAARRRTVRAAPDCRGICCNHAGGMPRQIHAHLVAGPCASTSPRASMTTPRGTALRVGGTLPLTRRAPTLGSLPLLCLVMFGVGLRLMLSKPRFRNAQELLAPRAPARTVQRTAVTRRTCK